MDEDFGGLPMEEPGSAGGQRDENGMLQGTAGPSREPSPEPYREPWMRGTHGELDALRRAVVHALELTGEDVERRVLALREEQMFAEPLGLPSVAFHLRHVVRSLDRLLTYAEGRSLGELQLVALEAERSPGRAGDVLTEFRAGLQQAIGRVKAFMPESYEQARGIGRKQLPTTVGGLLVHCAEHTQRHAGQAVTTARLLGVTEAIEPMETVLPREAV